MTPGLVSLVGAGPGDPELLTLKAVRRLEQADLILHDALVGRGVLALAPGARLLDVGKRARRRLTPQQTIHRIMIRAARAGERVVRLKGGDPFVLGRGGEEVLALAEAGIPFEVVPGVSSAVAAPALAGIPVTHRGLASGFLVVSGHAESAYRPVLGAVAPHTVTLVVLMGVRRRAAIALDLLERGWSPDTPAALIRSASTPDAETRIGTLGRWAREAPPPGDGPGTLVVGEVVRVAERAAAATASLLAAVEKGVPA